jgi:transcriptional regulator with AAA-type ATPase domain
VEAERLSAGLGDDQGLAVVLSNLAVLHARVGDPERADAAIARAAYHESRSDSARCRFLRLHSAGIVDLVFGRHGTAIDALRSAIVLGEDLKDVHMTAFELVYLAECHLHRGETRAAREALRRAEAVRPSPPGPIRAMAAARRAALAALRGERKEAEEECAAARRGLDGKVAYVDAWNRVFIGWALRLAGRADDARDDLEGARSFFATAKVPAGEVHAGLELAGLEIDQGALDAARAHIDAIEARHPAGKGVLVNPVLSARLLAYRAKLALGAAEPDIEAVESLLIEAESRLIGRRLKDVEALVADLKSRLRDPAAARGGSDPAGPGPLAPPCGAPLIVGRSAAMHGVRGWIRQVAATALPVLITGETGTGKELVARAIHGESARRSGPLVTVNCAALPEALLEAQLFGWSRGAFTGADEDRAGLIRSAHGGTFLFDGIGEMPLAVQAKLLRVLDKSTVRPVGGAEEVPIDVRFLFSSHRGLRALVEDGRFRGDLFFRLGPFEIQVPPLRDRLGDLPLLVEHFRGLAGLAEPAAFEEDALRALASHPWPGNVRELENVVTRLVLTSAERITAKDVRLALGKRPPEGQFSAGLLRSAPLEALLAQLEKEHLAQLHADCGGDLETIAVRLGITVRALYGRFRRLGVQPGALRARELPP